LVDSGNAYTDFVLLFDSSCFFVFFTFVGSLAKLHKIQTSAPLGLIKTRSETSTPLMSSGNLVNFFFPFGVYFVVCLQKGEPFKIKKFIRIPFNQN
jgi:hypothetical protein